MDQKRHLNALLMRTVSLPRRSALILIAALLVVISLLPAAVLGRTPPEWTPVALQNLAFDVRLAVAPTLKKAMSIAYGAVGDDRIYLDDEGTEVQLQIDGLTIAGTLYTPDPAGRHPGIVLVHGSTPEGRKLGLYRVLGRELASRGYIVLSIDQRGFGDSDDPPHLETVEVVDATPDVVNAADYLTQLDSIDPDRVYVIGHSAGAGTALAAGVQDATLQKIVAIGPPRRADARFATEDAQELAYFQRRVMRYMGVSHPIPTDVFVEIKQAGDIETYLEHFTSDDHKPIFLIDGALEGEPDRKFLEEICTSISEPKQCLTLANADHYANVANVGRLVIYDQTVVTTLADQIAGWLAEE